MASFFQWFYAVIGIWAGLTLITVIATVSSLVHKGYLKRDEPVWFVQALALGFFVWAAYKHEVSAIASTTKIFKIERNRNQDEGQVGKNTNAGTLSGDETPNLGVDSEGMQQIPYTPDSYARPLSEERPDAQRTLQLASLEEQPSLYKQSSGSQKGTSTQVDPFPSVQGHWEGTYKCSEHTGDLKWDINVGKNGKLDVREFYVAHFKYIGDRSGRILYTGVLTGKTGQLTTGAFGGYTIRFLVSEDWHSISGSYFGKPGCTDLVLTR